MKYYNSFIGTLGKKKQNIGLITGGRRGGSERRPREYIHTRMNVHVGGRGRRRKNNSIQKKTCYDILIGWLHLKWKTKTFYTI